MMNGLSRTAQAAVKTLASLRSGTWAQVPASGMANFSGLGIWRNQGCSKVTAKSHATTLLKATKRYRPIW